MRIKISVIDDSGTEYVGETKLSKKGVQENKRQQKN